SSPKARSGRLRSRPHDSRLDLRKLNELRAGAHTLTGREPPKGWNNQLAWRSGRSSMPALAPAVWRSGAPRSICNSGSSSAIVSCRTHRARNKGRVKFANAEGDHREEKRRREIEK